MTRIIIDTIHATVGRIPTDAPSVAGYITGSSDVEWTSQDWARFRGAKIRIDQSPFASGPRGYDVADIEAGAENIQEAIGQARARRSLGWRTTFYLSAGDLGAAEQAVAAAGLEDWVYYWVANWNLSQDEARALLRHRIVSIQYASPTSNPNTPLPGSSLTLSEANCDLSVAVEWWHAVPHRHKRRRPKPKPPHPKTLGASAGALLGIAITAILHAAGVNITPAEAGAISTLSALITGTVTPAHRKKAPA